MSIVIGIHSKDFPHDLYNLHKAKRLGKFEIVKRLVPKGKRERYYIKSKGVIASEHLDNYPTVNLVVHDSSDGYFNDILMTDSPYEIETNKKAIKLARGDVLECGLGIGYFTYYASKKPEVKSITIVEKEITEDKMDALMHGSLHGNLASLSIELVKDLAIKNDKKH